MREEEVPFHFDCFLHQHRLDRLPTESSDIGEAEDMIDIVPQPSDRFRIYRSHISTPSPQTLRKTDQTDTHSQNSSPRPPSISRNLVRERSSFPLLYLE